MSHNGTPTRIAVAVLVACALFVAAPPSASAITRSTVEARGRTWVLKNVPYSQSRFATVAGSLISTRTASPQLLGYRTDCSGFVSMCLGFKSVKGYPLSLSTATLDNVMVRIKKDELQRGDVILRPNDLVIGGKVVPYGHAVLFIGWLDDKHTRYVAYHESGSAKGTVRAEIEWGTSGFWNASGFAPYRYPGVEDAVRPPATTGP